MEKIVGVMLSDRQEADFRTRAFTQVDGIGEERQV